MCIRDRCSTTFWGRSSWRLPANSHTAMSLHCTARLTSIANTVLQRSLTLLHNVKQLSSSVVHSVFLDSSSLSFTFFWFQLHAWFSVYQEVFYRGSHLCQHDKAVSSWVWDYFTLWRCDQDCFLWLVTYYSINIYIYTYAIDALHLCTFVGVCCKIIIIIIISYGYTLVFVQFIHVQWNPSKADTIGTKHFVLYREVSLNRG